MPFTYNDGHGNNPNKNGKLIYNDNGTNKRVKYAYIGDGSEEGLEVYRGGNVVTYYIDTPSLLAPIKRQMFRWNGDDVLQDLDFTPTKDGYTFIGWSNSKEPCMPDGSGTYTRKTMIGEPITLYANFKKDVIITSYVYDAVNTSFWRVNTNSVVYNNGIQVTPTFTINPTTMPEYNFIGWSAGSPSSDDPKSPTATVAYQTINNVEFSESTNVYAIYHYKNNIHYGYSVNGNVAHLEGAIAINAFDTSNGGKWYPHLTLADPEKPNASFLGWSTDIDSREIDFYPFNGDPREPKVDNIPILNDNVMFYSIFKYANQTVENIAMNNKSGLIDGNNADTWLRFDSGLLPTYDCALYESIDATGTCSLLSQGVGVYLKDTFGGNQSKDGNDGGDPPQPKNGMLNGTFNMVLMDLPSYGATTLCVGVMSNTTAYVSEVNINCAIRLIGRTTVG